jgi:hypothetical protein
MQARRDIGNERVDIRHHIGPLTFQLSPGLIGSLRDQLLKHTSWNILPQTNLLRENAVIFRTLDEVRNPLSENRAPSLLLTDRATA